VRKITLLWLALTAFCAVALFHTSQKVHDERVKLAALDESIGKEQESLRLLSAEWSYLNQPARLEKLAKTYLGPLAPLKGSQFVKAEDIPLRGTVVAETAVVTPAAIIKIKDTTQPHHPRLARGPKSASARLVDSHDGQTALWTPAQGGGGSSTAHTSADTHTFTDLMKNLRSGVE
jgi:hypothetical protein